MGGSDVTKIACASLIVIAALGEGCGRSQQAIDPPMTERTPPACQIDARGACLVGCDADVPRKVVDVAPDLSGLDAAHLRGLEIAEILIDDRGTVKDVCLLRGVREDVDVRAIDAIRRWRYEPARLRHSTPPGALVSIEIAVTLRVGR
jgi:hypothetical protein